MYTCLVTTVHNSELHISRIPEFFVFSDYLNFSIHTYIQIHMYVHAHAYMSAYLHGYLLTFNIYVYMYALIPAYIQ